MKKMMRGVLGTWCAVLGVSVAQAEPVEFRDYDAATGTFTNAVRECALVTGETRTLRDGWYAVKGDVDFSKHTALAVRGTVHLILCDGASLTITNVCDNASDPSAAVTVTGSNKLTIYGQTQGTGRLTALGGEFNAGIGGYNGKYVFPDWIDEPQNCGTVTINGGTVTAQGGHKGAGIGGSDGADGGMVTIHGGTVTAQGGRGAAGIGNAHNRNHCRVTITGGKVTARKGQAIGAHDPDDIGYGECAGTRQPGVTVEISGGVFANTLKDEWCAQHYVTADNLDPETHADYPYTVKRQCVVTVGKCPPRMKVAWTSEDGSVTNGVNGESFDVPPGTANVRVIFAQTVDLPLDGDAVIDLGVVTGDVTFGVGNDYRISRPYSPFGDIAYVDWNGSEMVKTVLSKYDYLPVTEATRELGTDWYVVTNDVEFPVAANLQVTGAARLVLCDGTSLTVTNGPGGYAAVNVKDGKSLAIYGQNGNAGKLTATGGSGAAGIGGNSEDSCGTVTIIGGTVTAKGGDHDGELGGAGIGGGYSSSGKVVIRGGRVTAQGGGSAEDIGRGANAQSGAAVAISGGIFGRELDAGWIATDRVAVPNPDEATREKYPWMVAPASCMVTIGGALNMSAAWTSGDGAVTNAVSGTSFGVPGGSENVKVIFTADDGYEIVSETNEVSLGTVTENITFGEESGFTVPEVAITDPCLIAFQQGIWNMSVAWTRGDGSVTNVVAGNIKATYVPRGSENVRIICAANPGYELVGESVIDIGTVTENVTFGQGNDFRLPIAYDSAVNVVYLDWDEEHGRMTNAVATTDFKRWTAVTEATRVLKGCMVVTNDVIIPIADVSGAAVLVLCNDATLTVTGGVEEAGILVPSDTSLTITVRKGSSGRVVARGDTNCAGIGSKFKQGIGSYLGAVRIVAGTVTATGGRNAAGIGNGFYGKGGSVKIFGGAVTAIGGMGGASDIGDGTDPNLPCEVSVSGGVFARELNDDWLASGCKAVANEDEATKAAYPWTVALQPNVTVTVGDHPHMTAAYTFGAGVVTNALEDGVLELAWGTRNVKVIFQPDVGYELFGEPVADLGKLTADITFGEGSAYQVPQAVPTGATFYRDYDKETGTFTNAARKCTVVKYLTKELKAPEGGEGWFAVTNNVVIESQLVPIEVKGTVHLILCDGASLMTVAGPGKPEAGISVTNGASLTIYGQQKGTGVLQAMGGQWSAGIGGGSGTSYGCGVVTINGGTVEAIGGDNGAGIGGGYSGNGGTVTVNGGAVKAIGGVGAEDIGRGSGGQESGTVRISGGIFVVKPQVGWLATARSAVPNMDPVTADVYPWRVVESWTVVRPGAPMGSFETAEEATNAWASVEFVASDDVADALTTGDARRRYAGWFDLDVTSKAADEWYVEAILSDAAKTRLAETATTATRQIPVAEIAALTEGTKDVTVEGCEPGFYYTLYGGQGLTALPETGTAYRAEPCNAAGKVVFPEIEKPSAAAGFFTIGVSATK